MAKLTDLHIVKLFDDDRIVFDTPVSVTKDGMFTTTLPREAAETLESYGPKLDVNRAGRAGFFSSDTLEGLRREIEKAVNEAISKELVEDKLIIKYSVTTKCSYAIDTDGEIIPNGCWRKDPVERGKEYGTDWREGNANSRSYGNLPTVSVFARVFHKRTYAYRSGRTIQKLEIYRPKIKDGRGSSIDWINSLCNISSSDSIFDHKEDYTHTPEVDATEENAAMFVRLFKLIFQCNELFKNLNIPEFFLEMVAKNMPLAIEKK